jgi:DNA-binding response OmpR family regulator
LGAVSAGGAHVLIVEDNELVSDALRVVFESVDYRVSTAGSLAAAVSMVARDPAALVLLDLTLPDGDGLGFVGPAKDAGVRTIVALTGRDDDETRKRCLAAGCADVLLKPVSVKELLARAAGWLAG